MIPYLQAELSKIKGPHIIFKDRPVVFDTILSASNYSSDTGDFQCVQYDQNTGIFSIKRAGVYLVNWFVSQQTGLSSEGSNFGIIVNPGTFNADVIVGSSHVKISPASSFAIINATEDEVNTQTGKQFVLQNVSNHDATLSERTHVKSGISVFGVAEDNFTRAYGHWQAFGWDKITDPYDLSDGEAIKFNVALIPPFGMNALDSGTVARAGWDTFTLFLPGVYQISWEIPLEATYSVDEVSILLKLNGTTAYSRAYYPLPVGIIAGTAVIKTTNRNETLQLVNSRDDHGDLIQIGNYANITIHRIS